MQAVIRSAHVPVIAEADTVVVGGSFAGIFCALELAKAGRRVFVVEPRTYLGREWTAVLRPWLDREQSQNREWPALVRYAVERSGTDYAEHIAIHPDSLKKALEDMLLEQGAGLLYASLPVSVSTDSDGALKGLTIANKSGRQYIRCRQLIDATETALAAKLCGQPLETYANGNTALYYRTLEFVNADEFKEGELPVPEQLGLHANAVRLRQGCRGGQHVLAEFALALPSDNRAEADRLRELKARHVGMALAIHLIHNEPAFHKAVLSSASHELFGPFPVSGEKPTAETLTVCSFAASVPGVYSLFQPVYRDGDSRLLDAVEAASAGARLAADIVDGVNPWADRQAKPFVISTDAEAEMELAVPSLISGKDELSEWCGDLPVPIAKQVDVLVSGGGSSGASAAIRAAAEGNKTLLLDLNPGPGGTGTYGGVDSYWFGRKVGYASRIHDRVLAIQKDLHYKGHKWNLEAKTYALLSEADTHGADWLFNVITFGAAKKGNRVCGAVVATRWGPMAVEAKAVIDATGDGDVAAFAGASYVYGSEKDNTVMWYSLAQFQEPAKIQNNFTSMVDVSNVLDYTRAILAGRRRGAPDLHDHGIYIATRESRHIRGDVVMTLADQLLHRRWPDAVNVHFSNHDVKGVSGADWVNVGLIPPNLEIEIPYRMLLPEGLEGILVAGKAISATHDALPAIRMQADLENLGAVAALAASEAVKRGVTPREVPVARLQERLEADGLLPEGTSSRTLTVLRYTDEDLQQLVDRIETEPLFEYSNMRMNETYRGPIPFVEISSAGLRIIPILEQALTKAEGTRQIRIAQALAMLESQAGVPVLIDAIMNDMQGSELPVRTADIMYVQLPPDHGAMPDAAYLLYSLAQTKDKRSIPVWERVAELMERAGEDDFKDSMKGLYYYVDAVCQGAERLGERDAVPALQRLHHNRWLNGLTCDSGYQPDYFLERRAMLELAIARALACCGSREGYDTLVRYVTDARSLLAKQALLQLNRLTGQSFGKDASRWLAWLDLEQPERRTRPMTMKLDREHGESILRVVNAP